MWRIINGTDLETITKQKSDLKITNKQTNLTLSEGNKKRTFTEDHFMQNLKTEKTNKGFQSQ